MSKILTWLALPILLGAVVVYGRTAHHCRSADATAIADDSQCGPEDASDDASCCGTGSMSRCQFCAAASAGTNEEASIDAPAATDATIDPNTEIVFKAQGLTCPAVKGIGCGHMLAPTLERLDKLDSVAASAANYTGTLIRVSLAAGADRARVEAAVRKALAEDAGDAVPLAGDDLRQALAREKWRGTDRIGELSAIEFHVLAIARLQDFAKAEKLDKSTTDKLLAIAEAQWQRVVKEAAGSKASSPENWRNRGRAAIPAVLEQAKDILSADQMARLKSSLAKPRQCDVQPEAPPDPATTAAKR
jgi:hypothetical protein